MNEDLISIPCTQSIPLSLSLNINLFGPIGWGLAPVTVGAPELLLGDLT